MSTLILIRGLPGSGKSTKAKSLSEEGFSWFEADHFFIDSNGFYNYDPNKLKEAHAWCQEETRKALSLGKDVVVSNTFTRRWEMDPYLEMSSLVIIMTTKGNWGNVHGVPEEVIQRMKERWEE